MRSVIQRVRGASVSVDGEMIGAIDVGLVVLLGVEDGDDESDVGWMVDKTVHLRCFEDDAGKMNQSLLDIRGGVLLVSQFTLLGDCRKGRRPSFVRAAPPEAAERLYDQCAARLRTAGVEVTTGRFRADMKVTLTNDGPVTLLLDSRDRG